MSTAKPRKVTLDGAMKNLARARFLLRRIGVESLWLVFIDSTLADYYGGREALEKMMVEQDKAEDERSESSMPDALNLSALDALAQKATPGPWYASTGRGDTAWAAPPGRRMPIAECPATHGESYAMMHKELLEHQSNAAYIAAVSPEVVRRMIAEMRAMRADKAALTEYLNDICDAHEAWEKVVGEWPGSGIQDPDYPGPSNEECEQHDEACSERWNDVEDTIKTARNAREADCDDKRG